MDSSVDPGIDWRVFLGFAFLSLAVPIPWLSAGLAAALFHELGHIGALRLCGVRYREIHFGLSGAKILAPAMEPEKRLFCILAGPTVSLLLTMLHHTFPRIAICGFVQGIFNLLPIGELDGRIALRICCSMFLNREKKQKSLKRLLSGGIFLFPRNRACKDEKQRVQ